MNRIPGFKTYALPALASLTLVLAVPAAARQLPIDLLSQGTAHQALFAVDFDGQRGIAVGAGGEAQTTEDGGKTWTAAHVPTELSLLGVHLDAQRAIAVGQSGLIFLRAAQGDWQQIDSKTDKRLFSVDSNAQGLTVAVGEFGTLMLSDDGGRNWTPLTLDWMEVGTDGGVEPHLYGVNVDEEGAITVVGEFGMILRSTDHGRGWTVQSRAEASLFAVQIRSDGTGFAVGQDGYAVKTNDNGVTWACIDVGSKAILNGVYSTPDGHVTVTAMREMLTSSDGGNTWSAVENPEVTTMWYVGVGASAGTFYAVGQAGNIIRIGS